MRTLVLHHATRDNATLVCVNIRRNILWRYIGQHFADNVRDELSELRFKTQRVAAVRWVYDETEGSRMQGALSARGRKRKEGGRLHRPCHVVNDLFGRTRTRIVVRGRMRGHSACSFTGKLFPARPLPDGPGRKVRSYDRTDEYSQLQSSTRAFCVNERYFKQATYLPSLSQMNHSK